MDILIIDDEAPMRANLKALVHKYIPNATVVGEADGVQSGLDTLVKTKPNILFLDIEMKDGTGFDLLSQYGTPDFNVIFITGFDKYAIRAFKFSAVDYLMKPVDPQELIQAVQRSEAQSIAVNQQKVGNLIKNRQKPVGEQTIVLKDLEAVYLVRMKDIIRCKSENNYTVFFLEDGRSVTMSVTLKEYERLLSDQGFFRTHQSHLVNLAYFDRYEKEDTAMVYLKDGSSVPLSSRKKEFLLDSLKRFV